MERADLLFAQNIDILIHLSSHCVLEKAQVRSLSRLSLKLENALCDEGPYSAGACFAIQSRKKDCTLSYEL